MYLPILFNIHFFVNVKKLFNRLIEFFRYNYEIYLLLCDLLQSLAARTKTSPLPHVYQMVHVLVFLSSYVRVSSPQEIERNMWSASHQESENLPDIAAYR
jgi:hypothetical protein